MDINISGSADISAMAMAEEGQLEGREGGMTAFVPWALVGAWREIGDHTKIWL